MKPLGRKNYGSIAHLPNSRMGSGDHHCHLGQATIATEKPRDKHDVVIVQEKLDGSNVGVAKVNGQIIPLTRAGYHANTSKYEQHHMFAGWVMQRWQMFDELLGEGERVCGEWLAQAHGTRYDLNKYGQQPFAAFDIIRGDVRALFEEVSIRTCRFEIEMPHVLSIGTPLSVEAAMWHLGTYGYHGAIDAVEGAVWRVERLGKVDFLVKYVRTDKVDGCYLAKISGADAVWNWQPSRL